MENHDAASSDRGRGRREEGIGRIRRVRILDTLEPGGSSRDRLQEELLQLRLARGSGSIPEITGGLQRVARILRGRNRPYHALNYLNEAKDLFSRHGEMEELVRAMHEIGSIQFDDLTDMEGAVTTYRNCAAIAVEGQDVRLFAAALLGEASSSAGLGDIERGLSRARMALSHAEQAGSRGLIASIHNILTHLYQKSDPGKSLEHGYLAYALRRPDDYAGRSVDLCNIGRRHRALGTFDDAERYLLAALDVFDEADEEHHRYYRYFRNYALVGLSQLRLDQQEPEQAIAEVAELLASDDISIPKMRRPLAYATLMTGRAHAMMHDRRRATACVDRAMRCATRMSDSSLVAGIYRLMAEIAEINRGQFVGWTRGAADDDGPSLPSRADDAGMPRSGDRAIRTLKEENRETSRQLQAAGTSLARYQEALVRLRHRIDPHVLGRDTRARLARELLGVIDEAQESAGAVETPGQQLRPADEAFLRHLSMQYPDLTATELKICTMLRANLSSKEIAELLSVAVYTVETHRKHIRRKCGLRREENLQSFLLSIGG